VDRAAVRDGLAGCGYLADDSLSTVLLLALRLGRPLLLEGEAGVGKTAVATALAAWTGAPLLRLQCYEGISVAQALYEWDYARQLVHLRASETALGDPALSAREREQDLYSERFLIKRPLLRALETPPEGPAPVLLIDEVDRADDEFEAFLLEMLADYAITVPEIGTFRARTPPMVIITSNRTRDVHDALKRRCLYHWVEHPDFDREIAIVRLKVRGASRELATEVASVVRELRSIGLYKVPGVAETIDWVEALTVLGLAHLDEGAVEETLGVVLKYREDAERVRSSSIGELIKRALATAREDRDGHGEAEEW
jgi:MoxR-like ATPase